MDRRTLLAGLGAGTVSLAGCLTETGTVGTADGSGTPTDTESTNDATGETSALPDDCPSSQGFDVEWPENLDAAAVESFVEAYEHVYYRDVVVEYEPDSQLDSYDLSGGVKEGPREAGDGWELAYSGSGGVYRPTLLIGATTAGPPDGVDPVDVSEIDDEPLTDTLEAAAETGDAELHVEPPGAEVDRYVDLCASLSDAFDLSGPGDSDTLYVDVDDATVELSVAATNFHGDYWWDAWYYVDEQVVRRTTDDADPRDGDLLECRTSD